MNDQLGAATRALRLARSGASATSRATEERVVARVAGQSRRTRRVHWLLPIAAVLAVSSGWAATQPGVQREARIFWHRLTASRPAPTTPNAALAPQAPSPGVVATAGAASAAPAFDANEARPASSLPARASMPSSERTQRRADAPTATPQAPVASAPEQPTSFQLYQRAHELHFRKHDFAAALGSWDTYLASAPTGELVLEARYNRGICLTRLGRTAEARAALLPFARGDYGGYRQAEANVLINGSASQLP